MANVQHDQPMEGRSQFYIHPNIQIYSFPAAEALDLPPGAGDEGGGAGFFRADGDGGCLFFPEKIEVGDNTIIGYNSTILTHEYLIKEYRLGRVRIGSHVMIGANTTILPGVTIGDHAVIGAGSVVHKDVAPYSFVAGNPLRVIREDVRKEPVYLNME